MKARELIVLERMQESNETGNIYDSICDNDDFKEGFMIVKAILKNKSENHKNGMLEGLLF